MAFRESCPRSFGVVGKPQFEQWDGELRIQFMIGLNHRRGANVELLLLDGPVLG